MVSSFKKPLSRAKWKSLYPKIILGKNVCIPGMSRSTGYIVLKQHLKDLCLKQQLCQQSFVSVHETSVGQGNAAHVLTRTPVISFCLLPLVLLLDTTEKGLAPFS